MTAAAITESGLLAVLLDALEDAFWARRAVIEGCDSCHRNPAGICVSHQADNNATYEYEEARKQIERSPGSPEVLAVLANGGQS